MPRASIFQWRDGAGWLVLSGGGDFRADETLDIDASVLSRTISDAPLAHLWSAGDIESADLYLDYVRDLGGRTGFLVDVLNESEEAIHQQIGDAGIVILGDGAQSERLHRALRGVVLNAIEQAYYNGATIYAVGSMAMSFAAWMPAGTTLQPGLGWLENALVAAPYSEQYAEHFKTWLRDVLPDAYGVGIGRKSALAFNPDGSVEIWGEQNISIVLGKNLSGESATG